MPFPKSLRWSCRSTQTRSPNARERILPASLVATFSQPIFFGLDTLREEFSLSFSLLFRGSSFLLFFGLIALAYYERKRRSDDSQEYLRATFCALGIYFFTFQSVYIIRVSSSTTVYLPAIMILVTYVAGYTIRKTTILCMLFLTSYFSTALLQGIQISAMITNTSLLIVGYVFAVSIAKSVELRTLLDVQERKTTATLLHREKLATLGTISAGVAHQLENTLNAIAASTIAFDRMLKRETLDKNALHECASQIKKSLSLSKHIIWSMNSVSKSNDEVKPNNFHDIIESAIVLTKGKALESVALRNDVPADLIIRCSASSLIQVFMNLLSNAVDAVPAGGGIVSVRITSSNEQSVLVDVVDNGPGIPRAEQGKIFEAFYTSKLSEEGTGLGLYLVKTEVELHGGKIHFDSGPTGTTFHLELPR